MNKKFKELANKAGFTSCTKRMQALLEAYGEEIVNECVAVCADHSIAAGGVDTPFGYGYKDCGDDIQRNFGIYNE